ncbi:MAG: cell division protein FtsA [Bauldia sp.]|nr:cell division protein FtsA [Bauldia sp.]
MKLIGPADGGSSLSRLTPKKTTAVAVLDIGSSKICCMIARLKPSEPGEALPGRTHTVQLIGIGHQKARGVKSGAIVDLEAAERAIRLAVDAAERMARVTIDSLVVNVASGRLASETFSAQVPVAGAEVGEADIGRVLAAGRAHSVSEGRTVVHSLPIGYSLDGHRGVRDPRGMVGRTLGVDMHVVTANFAPLENLELCVNRSHLAIAATVANPYASGLATLVDDEADLGVVTVDLGAATTTMAVFLNGQFIHADGIAIGGHHITVDIARGLSTSLESAERLKLMHGSALVSGADDADILSVPPLGDEEREVPNRLPRAALNRIIRARVEEILELVRDRLNDSGFAALVGRRIVLTGGASQLNGLAEAARRILARNVRLGRPLGVSGLPEVARGPSHATTVGMLIYPQAGGIELSAHRPEAVRATGTGGYFSRFSRWLKESF